MTGLLDHFEGFMLDVAAIVDGKHNNDAADVCHNYQLPLARWDDKDREVSQIFHYLALTLKALKYFCMNHGNQMFFSI